MPIYNSRVCKDKFDVCIYSPIQIKGESNSLDASLPFCISARSSHRKKNTGPVDNHVETTVLVLVLYCFNLNLIHSYEGKIT